MWTPPQLDKQMCHSFGNERKIHHSSPGEVQMCQPSKTVQTWTCSQVYKLLTLYQPLALVYPLSQQCPGCLEVQLLMRSQQERQMVTKRSLKMGILNPEEANMLNNQELEGDCILVEHMLEITDHTPLSSEVSTSRVGEWHLTRLEQDELIHTDFGCEQAIPEKDLLPCSSPECNFIVSSPAPNFPLWHLFCPSVSYYMLWAPGTTFNWLVLQRGTSKESWT